MDTPREHSRQDEEKLSSEQQLAGRCDSFSKEEGEASLKSQDRPEEGTKEEGADGINEKELDELVDCLLEEMRFDAFIAARQEEARKAFMQYLHAHYEEKVKNAQSMRRLDAPEAFEQASDEHPNNA